LSTPSQTSIAEELIAELVSSQSPAQVVNPSPSTSKSSSTDPSQSSSTPSQDSMADGLTDAFVSSQSPPCSVHPSPSSS
jgi:hypothetical protein